MNPELRSWKLGLALSLVTVLFWGMLPVALKGLLTRMDVTTITWFRFLVAALVLGGWLGWQGKIPRPGALTRKTGLLFGVAVVGLCGNYVVYLNGLDHVTPATAQVVVQLAPMSLLVGSLLLFGESFSRIQTAGLLVFLTGLGLFFNHRLAEVAAGLTAYSWGVALVVGAALLWGAYALAQKKLLARHSSFEILWVIYLAGAVLFLPASDPGVLERLDGGGWALLLFCCLNTLIAYGCFAEALARWDGSRVSAVLAATPLATASFAELSAWLVPGLVPPESWSLPSLTGALLVAAGCGTAALGKADPRPAPARVP